MSSSGYRFSVVLSGHSADVRCLAAFDGPLVGGDDDASDAAESAYGLLSGSRDFTAKLWRPNPADKDRTWLCARTYAGHDRKYVSAVAVRPPCEKYPAGLLYTGSQSGHIRVFSPATLTPLLELEAHSECVSSLYLSRTGTLLSGSWDRTAKVFVDEMKLVMTLTGHEAAVWAAIVLPEAGIMVTGSADREIRLWLAGQCQQVIEEAHTQAVRDLAVVGSDTFMSCSNDCSVKLWQVSTDSTSHKRTASAVQTIVAHDNFIYTLGILDAAKERWICAGENSGIKVFEKGEVTQVLPIPAISVWSVVVLPNGDLAAACSDGKIWVFSADEKRQADSDLTAVYESELSKFQRPAATELEGINPADLPGPNALLSPGRRDGQTKMVKDGEIISIHSWSQAEQKWTKIGDVVGQPKDGGGGQKGAAPGGGKVTFENAEYDFVFDIDVEDGVIFKLPYNRDQEPFMVAQKFIHKHDLPQAYLETIANFIVTNSGGGQRPTQSTGEYYDPFTGSNAYTTNGDSNQLSSGPAVSMEVDNASTNTYFPQTEFISFAQKPNFTAMNNKLKEFNQQVPDDVKMDEAKVQRLHHLCSPDLDSTTDDLSNLMVALRWPSDKAFPALDVLRLTVINAKLRKVMLEEDQFIDKLLSLLLANIQPNVPDNCQMLALRTMTNLFKIEKGVSILLQNRDSVIARLTALFPKDNKNVQVALASVMLNYCVALTVSKSCFDQKEGQAQALSALSMLYLEAVTECEARFRTLVALGTLLAADHSNVTLAKDFGTVIGVKTWKMAAGENKKLEECAEFVLRMLA